MTIAPCPENDTANDDRPAVTVTMENRISRIPRPIVDESALPNVNSVPQPNVVYANSPNIIETLPILDVPESQIAPATIQTTTTPISANNPINGTLATLATLGIITASAGAISMTATALAKKREHDEAKSAQMATLQAQQSAQAQSASANWEQNQTMQAGAKQSVVTQVMQSQANIEFMDGINRWYQQSIIAKISRQLQQAVTLTGIRDTVNQAWGRYGSTQDAQLGVLFEYWMQTYGNITGVLDETHIQDTNPFKTNMENAFGYNIQWGNALAENMVGQWKSLANLLASNLHIASYFNENMNNYMPSNNIEQGLEVIRNYFAKIPIETGISPTTIYLGKDDKTGGKDLGYVPLPASTSDAIELKTIYLGSDVNVATITHELGHQLDRWFKISHIQDNITSIDRDFTSGITGYLSTNTVPITNTVAFDIYTYIGILNSFAGKQLYPEEFWADIFMTAVLDGQDFGVFSLDFENINYRSYGSQLARFTDFITCEKDENDNWSAILTLLDGTELKITCTEDKLVAWQDNNNARSIKDYVLWTHQNALFPNLFELGDNIIGDAG